MIVMVINILLNPVSGLDFSFSYPEEVQAGEEFEVIIELDTSDEHDVKIYVHEAKKGVSEIFDGSEWKNPFYYLQRYFPNVKTYYVRTNYTGESEICVQLRNSETEKVEKKCSPIVSQNLEEEQLVLPEEDEDPKLTEIESSELNEDNTLNNSDLKSGGGNVNQFNKIVLNSPTKTNNVEEKIFVSKEEKIRLGVIYGFVIICVVIIILLSLKKL